VSPQALRVRAAGAHAVLVGEATQRVADRSIVFERVGEQVTQRHVVVDEQYRPSGHSGYDSNAGPASSQRPR
jgi:hypothetical protein